MLQQNDWHLKDMPTLTYVARFDFIAPLNLEQCSQRLMIATRETSKQQQTTIYEVSRESDSKLLFGAKYAMNQSAWYLAGQITPVGNQSKVTCYSGLPIVTLIPPFIILVIVLALVGLTNHLSIIAVLGLFLGVLALTWLIGIRYVRSFRQILERDIRKLLS